MVRTSLSAYPEPALTRVMVAAPSAPVTTLNDAPIPEPPVAAISAKVVLSTLSAVAPLLSAPSNAAIAVAEPSSPLIVGTSTPVVSAVASATCLSDVSTA